MNRKELDLDNEQTILNIYNCANEIFGSGIAIPVDGGHPCGWEWLDFAGIENILEHEFEDCEISNGCSNGDYTDKTLKDILKMTNGKFAFEINVNTIDWNKD